MMAIASAIKLAVAIQIAIAILIVIAMNHLKNGNQQQKKAHFLAGEISNFQFSILVCDQI